jgi:ribonuclease D
MSKTLARGETVTRPFAGNPGPPEIVDDLPISALEKITADGIVACDIETSGLDWSSDQIGTFQLFGSTAGAYVVRVNGQVPTRLTRLLADAHICKVFHHAPFDLRFILAQWNVRALNVKCTKIASKIVFAEAPHDAHSLKPLLERVAQVEITKEARLSDWLSDELTEEQVEYAISDVVYLIPLLDALESLAASKGLLDLLHRCFTHIPTRAELDVRGYEDIYEY